MTSFSELAIGSVFTFPQTGLKNGRLEGYVGRWIKLGSKRMKMADDLNTSGFPVYVDFDVIPATEPVAAFCD